MDIFAAAPQPLLLKKVLKQENNFIIRSMVVVYGYGKEPMVLLTNKRVQKKAEVLSILKAYIIRWRIEEMFRVQKQEFDLENVWVRTLRSLKRMFLLVSIMISL
ncbi:hypothetical protein ACUL41_03585 [Virgibacillus natechei]